jgi:hypothetical protein
LNKKWDATNVVLADQERNSNIVAGGPRCID